MHFVEVSDYNTMLPDLFSAAVAAGLGRSRNVSTNEMLTNLYYASSVGGGVLGRRIRRRLRTPETGVLIPAIELEHQSKPR